MVIAQYCIAHLCCARFLRDEGLVNERVSVPTKQINQIAFLLANMVTYNSYCFFIKTVLGREHAGKFSKNSSETVFSEESSAPNLRFFPPKNLTPTVKIFSATAR